ncbi:hypothetical protein M514_27841 [Trichuris suis]|uniref:Uncharacterized protein n=1 Tax=Trichuris suis TaxID=68888 RepID=A0A085MRZ7_9BILA|nr:hypothetical protein M514_27841 [Trichuris suis]
MEATGPDLPQAEHRKANSRIPCVPRTCLEMSMGLGWVLQQRGQVNGPGKEMGGSEFILHRSEGGIYVIIIDKTSLFLLWKMMLTVQGTMGANDLSSWARDCEAKWVSAAPSQVDFCQSSASGDVYI